MHTPSYNYKPLYMIEAGLSFLIILIGIMAYLREIGYLVGEKEERNIELM